MGISFCFEWFILSLAFIACDSGGITVRVYSKTTQRVASRRPIGFN